MAALAIDTRCAVRALQEAGFEEAHVESVASKIGAAIGNQHSIKPA